MHQNTLRSMFIRPGGWRLRIIIDLLTLLAVATIMLSQGAPAWSVTLLVYIATRPSRLELAADMSALKGED